MIIRIVLRFFRIKGGAVLRKLTSPQNGKVQTYEKRIAVQIQNAGSLLRFIAVGS